MKTRVYAVHIAIMASASVIAMPALAQTVPNPEDRPAASPLGDIIVTANKRQQNIADVPISITSYSSADIEKLAIRDLKDYATLTPNVGFANDGSPGGSAIFIRGVGNLGGAVNSVVTYIDEVSVTPSIVTGSTGEGLNANDPNLADVERIEVLRGPQGVSFGRSALGGVVNITTAKPAPDLSGKADAEYGSFGTGLVRGTINIPVSSGVYARGNAYYTFSDGYLRNIGPSKDSNGYDGYGGSLALRFLAGADTTIDIRDSYRKFHQNLATGVPTGVSDPVLASFGFANAQDDGQGFYPTNRRTVSTDRPTNTYLESNNITGRLEHDFGPVTAILIGGYLNGSIHYSGDGDMTRSDYSRDLNAVDYSSSNIETRLQSSGSGSINYVIGFNYNRDVSKSYFYRTFGRDFFGGAVFGISPIDERVNSTVESYAGFADISWKGLADRLTLSIGGRYSRDTFDGTSEIYRTGPGVGAPATSGGSNSSNGFSPRFNIVYAIQPRLNIYGTVSRGYKPAGRTLTQTPTNPATGLPFAAKYGQETIWNYEVGLKGELFDRRLRFNLSAFYMSWTNIQISTGTYVLTGTTTNGVPDAQLYQITQNGPKAVSKGVEFDMTVRPINEMILNVAAGYNDARFERFANAVYNDPTTGSGAIIDATGNRLPLSPKWSISAGAEFRPYVNEVVQPFMRFDWTYKAGQFLDVSNIKLVPIYIPAYDYFNAQIGVEFSKYKAIFFVNNITDSNYISGFNGTEFFSGARAAVNPRTLGVRLSASF